MWTNVCIIPERRTSSYISVRCQDTQEQYVYATTGVNEESLSDSCRTENLSVKWPSSNWKVTG